MPTGLLPGVVDLSALILGTEVMDWHRFAIAEAFMGFTGLVPSEYSSGDGRRCGHITKTGNRAVRTVLAEAAHAYRHHPAIGATLARRQPGPAPTRSPGPGPPQQRLCDRYRRMSPPTSPQASS